MIYTEEQAAIVFMMGMFLGAGFIMAGYLLRDFITTKKQEKDDFRAK